MLKQGSFVNKKFNRLLFGCIWGSLATSVNLMTDSLISGNQLGETALQAVTVVYPLFSIVYFFSALVPSGASVLFGKHIGAFEDEDARRCAGTSVCFSILVGITLSLSLWLLKMPLLNYFGCTGELFEQASAYYNWVIPFAAISPLTQCLYYLVMTDGEASLISLGCALDIVANISLSIILSRIFGVAGLAMATCIGLALDTTCYFVHFLRKSNNVKVHLCIDFKIVGRSIVLSFSIYMYYLFIALVDIIFNKFIITNCGEVYLPAYSVVNLVFNACDIFLCLYNSSVGLITCFYGEKNNHGLKIVFRKLLYSFLIMGGCVTAVFFFGAPLMPIIYGLETPVTISASIMTSRIISLTVLGYGAFYLGGMIALSVEKPFLSFFMSFLSDGFAPLILSLIMGSLWGFFGIVTGMSVSSYFALGIYSLVLILYKGKKGYPIYVEDFGEEGFSYDIHVNPESLIELRNAVKEELQNHAFEIKNIDLLIEEFFTRIMEKNPGKTVTAECTLLFGTDHVRVIIRDDGVLFDFVDENNKIESLNAHVLNSLLEQTEQKNYLVTTSFNRNGFVFER